MNAVHIVVAMKPCEAYADNALERGVAGLNIEATRIGVSGGITKPTVSSGSKRDRWDGNVGLPPSEYRDNGGRFPSNIIHDGSDEVTEQFPETESGIRKQMFVEGSKIKGAIFRNSNDMTRIGDSGSAARYFKECKV